MKTLCCDNQKSTQEDIRPSHHSSHLRLQLKVQEKAIYLYIYNNTSYMRQKLTATWNIVLLTSSSGIRVTFLLLHCILISRKKHSLDSCWNHSRLHSCCSIAWVQTIPWEVSQKREKDDDKTNHTRWWSDIRFVCL